MPSSEAHRIVDELYEVKQDTNTEILINFRPNICIIILESWSADMIKSCGGLDGITPNFDSLARHGILFDNNSDTRPRGSPDGIEAPPRSNY